MNLHCNPVSIETECLELIDPKRKAESLVLILVHGFTVSIPLSRIGSRVFFFFWLEFYVLGYFVYSESYRHNPICTCLTKEDITLPSGGGICSPPCLLPQWTHCSEAEHSSLEKHCSPAGTCGSPLPCEPALTNQKSAFTSVSFASS